MGNRTTNVVRNLTWGFFNKIIMVIAPFLTRTVMIYTLGSMYVGLNGLFTSIEPDRTGNQFSNCIQHV